MPPLLAPSDPHSYSLDGCVRWRSRYIGYHPSEEMKRDVGGVGGGKRWEAEEQFGGKN